MAVVKLKMQKIKYNFVIVGVLVIFISSMEAAPPNYYYSTESPYPVATTHSMDRRRPVYRHEEEDKDIIDYYDDKASPSGFPTLKSTYFSPSQLVLTVLRTLLEVLRIVNKKKIESLSLLPSNKTKIPGRITSNNSNNMTITSSFTNQSLESSENNNAKRDTGREMGHDGVYDLAYDHHFIPEEPPMASSTEAPKEMVKQSRYSDPWEGYYEFIITEGSFKFWSAFQLATSGLLLYSALAAIYYAKFNPIQPDYDTTYDDYFFGRSLDGDSLAVPGDSAGPAPGWLNSIKDMGVATYQRIMNAVHTTEDLFS